MIKAKLTVAHSDLSSFLSKYQDVEHFLKYCKACHNYNALWSCPPMMFNPTNFLNKYSDIYIVGAQIFYADELRTKYQTKDEIINFTRITLRRAKNIIANNLLELEKIMPDSLSFSSGGCGWCCKCTRPNNLPCRKPEKMRYSLDSFGINLGNVSEDFLNIKLLWGLDKLPQYHTLIHAVVGKHELDLNSFTKHVNTIKLDDTLLAPVKSHHSH